MLNLEILKKTKKIKKLRFKENDGGRLDAGRKGATGDCVCRAISIATGKNYLEVYERLAVGNKTQRRSKNSCKFANRKTASHGIYVKRKWFKDYMHELGFEWKPLMSIGVGCQVHLAKNEIPNKGIYICALSKHYTTVVNGVINDTYDPSREGTRCVYGYWKKL